MVYDLPVMGGKVKPHQVTALHLLCALAFTGTGAIIAIYNYTIPKWGFALLMAGVALLVITIARNKWLTTTKANFLFRVGEFIISASIAILSIIEQWKFPMGIFGILCAAILFAMFWERAAGQALFIHVDEKGVLFPVTSRKRFVPWVEIEQVVLKYGILSVDCADNHLHQWDVANDANSQTFEAYCSAQVEANRANRRHDEW